MWKMRKPQAALLVLCGLSGCDGAPGPEQPPSTAIQYEHAGPTAQLPGLPDYRYVPAGSGLSQSASSAGVKDASLDYGLALRTAAIKLTGNLPSLQDMKALRDAELARGAEGTKNDPRFVYTELVRGYIYNNPVQFNRQMMQFWRNTMRMGGDLSGLFQDLAETAANAKKKVSLETAPAFAARLVAEDKDMRQLFTQSSNTCPTFNYQDGTFADGSCFVANATTLERPGNNVAEGSQAGVLTNPGFLAQYYSNFAFRRARIVNELFACTRYPAEFRAQPLQVGAYLYSSPWDPNGIPGSTAGTPPVFDLTNLPRKARGGVTANSNEYVDFRMDCRSCHTTLNRRAPLFAVFDQVGFRHPMNQFMVTSTATGSPFAQVQEYLQECNPDPAKPVANATCKKALAWRFEGARIDSGGTAVPDFQTFGKEMAADPQVAKCFMIRIWNHAYSRDDVVNELALVPDSVIEGLTAHFVAKNYSMKAALLKLYTDPNYIRF